jgi:hypothetical protein
MTLLNFKLIGEKEAGRMLRGAAALSIHYHHEIQSKNMGFIYSVLFKYQSIKYYTAKHRSHSYHREVYG